MAFRGPTRPVAADAHLGALCAFQVILQDNKQLQFVEGGPVKAEMKGMEARNDVQSSGQTRSHGTEPGTITRRGPSCELQPLKPCARRVLEGSL